MLFYRFTPYGFASFLCLVILIVTSLLYIVNNDIKEYMDHGDNNMDELEDNVNDNLNEAVSYVENNRCMLDFYISFFVLF